MNKILMLALLSMAAYPFAASAATAPTTPQFVSQAEMGGQLEVQAGRLASQKGQTAAVKHFGQRMVRDHTNLDRKLDKAIAKSQHKDLPKEMPLDQEAQSTLQKFQSASAGDFDHVYIDTMVADHKKDISEFENYAKSGDDPVIRSAAKKALPVLRKHLALAEHIQKNLKK